MKILFFADRVNIDLFKGDSILLKRMMQGLAERENQVYGVCHGNSDKAKIFPPGNFWFYTKAFTFPLTSFFSFRKFISLLEKESFDAVILKLPVASASGFWAELRPLFRISFYSRIVFELKKRKIPFFVFVEGITEKNDFVSFLMDCSKETQISLMKESNGIISLSPLQNEILSSFGIKKPKTFFPAPVDSKKYSGKKGKFSLNLSAKKINLLYLSSSCDLKDFIPFFGLLEENKCILYVISPNAPDDFRKQIKQRNLEEKIIFLHGFSNKSLFGLIPFFDAGVYLKKFNSSLADASFMVKISEYLSSGLPVLVPEINGPLLQAGKAGINFEKKTRLNKIELKNLSLTARKIAVENLDLDKNVLKLENWMKENK
ncbi:glycosyltransferase [Candidatus Micrarchaeota archaeon]|nr:glycosyltransferase [Candidatus Micrarchaeota archaeon]MBU2475921.1 glycosyltransferase [Candidatus Micrarchaeota archaeon]